MQYLICKFRETDARSYTYQNDGEPVAIGDVVKVPDRNGDGWKRVAVIGLADEKPTFECKNILGKVEPEDKSTDERKSSDDA